MSDILGLVTEATDELGAAEQEVKQLRAKLILAQGRLTAAQDLRRRRMRAAVASGYMVKEIAKAARVTPGRISQLLKK